MQNVWNVKICTYWEGFQVILNFFPSKSNILDHSESNDKLFFENKFFVGVWKKTESERYVLNFFFTPSLFMSKNSILCELAATNEY